MRTQILCHVYICDYFCSDFIKLTAFMKRLMFVAILAVVSLSMMATVKKVKMYDNPPKNKDVVMNKENNIYHT